MRGLETVELGPRLPKEGAYAWLAGPLGRPVLRPWFDSLAFVSITYGMLPLSRAWAAAVDSGGSRGAFMSAFPGRSWAALPIGSLLGRIERRRRDYEDARQDWEDLVFGEAAVGRDSPVVAEIARRRAQE